MPGGVRDESDAAPAKHRVIEIYSAGELSTDIAYRRFEIIEDALPLRWIFLAAMESR
jgi:hypothetical protein